MTNERVYGRISIVDAPPLDVSNWRPDLAEGYLAWQDDERRIRRRRRRSLALLGVSGTLVLAFLAVAAPTEWRSVRTFHAITPWSQPARIHYCGRDYDPGGVPEPRSALRLIPGIPLTKVMRGNHGQPILAQVTLGHTIAWTPTCTMVLYEQRSSKYQAYVLSGGP